MSAEDRDLERAAAGLASRLPEPLAIFARIAHNYRWSWADQGAALFAAIDPHRWDLCGRNPVRLLQEAPAESLAAAAADEALIARAHELLGLIDDDLARPASAGPVSPECPAAIF